jgi:tRNA(Ile)-lysidine synthase TilS/MesJ
MNRNEWQKVKKIFDAALELAPNQRKWFLDKSCGSDDSLRREVENLLASFADDSFMEQPAVREVASLIVERNNKAGRRQTNHALLNSFANRRGFDSRRAYEERICVEKRFGGSGYSIQQFGEEIAGCLESDQKLSYKSATKLISPSSSKIVQICVGWLIRQR